MALHQVKFKVKSSFPMFQVDVKDAVQENKFKNERNILAISVLHQCQTSLESFVPACCQGIFFGS